MKPSIIGKYLIIIPAELFADYLLMSLLGCASCLRGTEKYFNCNAYCLVGKILLFASLLLIVFLIVRDYRHRGRSPL